MAERYQFPQPSRSELGKHLMAAWLGVPVDKLPVEMQAHTCDATRRSWARVADAAHAYFINSKPARAIARDGEGV